MPLLINAGMGDKSSSKLRRYSLKSIPKRVIILANLAVASDDFLPFSDMNQIPVGGLSYFKKGIHAKKTITLVGIMKAAKNGWKCISSSCTPAKYHGAFVGLRLKVGLAFWSKGALNRAENKNSTAISARATINSLKTRFGITGTISDSFSPSGNNMPPALRTCQK